MKIYYLLLPILCVLSITASSQQIDSLVENISPYMGNGKPQQQVAFNIYVNDTTNIDSAVIQLGYEAEGVEMFSGSIALRPLSVQNNASTNAMFLAVEVGIFDLYPPFVRIYFIKRNGTPSTYLDKQLLY